MTCLDQTFLADGVTFSMLITVRRGDTIELDDTEYEVGTVEESASVTSLEADDGGTERPGLTIALSASDGSVQTLELNRDRELFVRDANGDLLTAPGHISVPDPHHRELDARRRDFHLSPDTVEENETHSALDALRGVGPARQYLASSTKRNGTQVFDFFEVDIESGTPISTGLVDVLDSYGLEVASVVDGAGPFGEASSEGYTVVLTFR
jgi:hypothetical protein